MLIVITDSNILFLKTVELCVTVFRGPDAAVWAAMTESGVPELLCGVQSYPDFPVEPLFRLQAGLNACQGDYTPLETEYVRLFIAGPGGIPAPLYHSCHQGDRNRTMGQPAREMRDRLAETGLAVSLPSNEPPDHLAIELEYLYHLLATGWANDDQALVLRGSEFAANTMLPWVRCFRDALAAATPHPVFLDCAGLMAAVLALSPGV